MKLPRVSAFVLILASLGLSACSSTTEPQSTNLWKSADVGTAYLFEGSSTRTTVQDSTTTRTEDGSLSLIAGKTEQTIGGKTNVTEFVTDQGGGPYIAYEPNGDFSIGDSSYSGWNWMTYPTGSHSTILLPSVDSVDPYGTRHTLSGSRRYVGQETLTLAGHSYTASKVTEVISMSDSSDSYVTRELDSVSIWWVPELKMFGKYVTDDQTWETYPATTPRYYRLSLAMQLVMYGQRTKQGGGGAIQ